MAPSGGKLSKNSTVVRRLLQLLENSTLSGEEEPSFVYKSDPLNLISWITFVRPTIEFARRYSFQRVSSVDMHLKTTELTIVLDAHKQANEDLNPRCSVDDDEAPSKKRKLTHVISYDDGLEMNEYTSSFSMESGCKIFKPFYSISVWEEARTTTKRISLAILLPSGIESDDFSVRILPKGDCVGMKCTWPSVFSDVEKLHRKWLWSDVDNKIKPYHPKLLGFENYLKEGLKRSNEPIDSVTHISLPVQVEIHIYAKYYMAWRGTYAKAYYVELRAQVEEYRVVLEKTEFEIC